VRNAENRANSGAKSVVRVVGQQVSAENAKCQPLSYCRLSIPWRSHTVCANATDGSCTCTKDREGSNRRPSDAQKGARHQARRRAKFEVISTGVCHPSYEGQREPVVICLTKTGRCVSWCTTSSFSDRWRRLRISHHAMLRKTRLTLKNDPFATSLLPPPSGRRNLYEVHKWSSAPRKARWRHCAAASSPREPCDRLSSTLASN
jgi:hypothetical protein